MSGVGSGDRVAILAPMSPVFLELLFACARIGAMMMPINWRLSAREIAGIMADGNPHLILVGSEFLHLLAETESCPPKIGIEAEYPEWRGSGSLDLPAAGTDPHAPVLLLYTSGTTGQPKGVMLSQANLALNERTAREAWGFDRTSVNLVAMPLFHIGGIGYGLMALSQGGVTVLHDGLDPEQVLDAIADFRVTHAFFVPAVIQRLVDHADRVGGAPSGLRRMIYGASPIGEGLLRRAIATFGCAFHHAYGMTETAGTVITLPPEYHNPDATNSEVLRSCGKPLPWVEFALIDPQTSQPVSVGEVGEIRVRSAMNMVGYWNKPEETAAVIDEGGWLATGDAAYQDADGFVYIHDRYKDMIVSGGENIYPAEVENVLADQPDIAEVSVIGIAHEKWGETPRAYAVPKPDCAPTERQVIDFVRSRLAHYKCPTSVVFVDTLPRTASGKVMKQELRKLAKLSSRAAPGSAAETSCGGGES